MLKIIKIEKNPRKKKRKTRHSKRVAHIVRNFPKGRKRTALLRESEIIRKSDAAKRKRRKIIKAKKNPPKALSNESKAFLARRAQRRSGEKIIVGYTVRAKYYTRGGRRKTQRLYFTGKGFSKHKYDAKIYRGDGAAHEANRILPMLPFPIYEIRVEPRD